MITSAIPTAPQAPKAGGSLRWRLTNLLCAVLYYTGLLKASLALRRLVGGGRLRVLCYHRVAEDGWPGTLQRSRFVRHLRHLMSNYRLVSVREVGLLLAHRRSLPRDAICLTFDDGHREAFGVAELLAEAGVPATFFILTGDLPNPGVLPADVLVGADLDMSARELGSLPPPERSAILSLVSAPAAAPRLLTTPELAALTARGFEIGSHTRHHGYLPALSDRDQREEIEGSARDLERELGLTGTALAYPWGASDPRARRAAREAGYSCAFATGDRAIDPEDDPYDIPRIHVAGNASVARLAAEAAGIIEALRRVF